MAENRRHHRMVNRIASLLFDKVEINGYYALTDAGREQMTGAADWENAREIRKLLLKEEKNNA